KRKIMCEWRMAKDREGGKDLLSGASRWRCRIWDQSLHLTKNILIGTESGTGVVEWHGVAQGCRSVWLRARALAREVCLRRTPVYPVPCRAIGTLRTSCRRRHRQTGKRRAGDAVARRQGRCYTVPYAIGSRHRARSYGTHREDGFYQLSPSRRAMGVGGLRGLNSTWLRRIHRLR